MDSRELKIIIERQGLKVPVGTVVHVQFEVKNKNDD